MLEHYKQKYTPDEQVSISAYLRQPDRAANVMVFAQGLIEIYRAHRKLNLQGIERILRQSQSRTYLIALDMESMVQYEARLPGSEKLFPYYLWIEVNWEQSALTKMREVGINYQQNFDRLPETGLLTPKLGTEVSRALKSHLN